MMVPEDSPNPGVESPQPGAEEVQSAPSEQGTAAPEPTEQQAPSSWKIGDTEYNDPAKMAEAFQKFQGEYTRSRQEISKLKEESSVGMELLNLVRSDPKLLAEVKARVSAGQDPQQAAQQSVENDPRFKQLSDKVSSLEQQRDEESRNYAAAQFLEDHPDVDEAAQKEIKDFIEENQEWLEHMDSYEKVLDVAYSAIFRKRHGAKILEQGQKMKEQEIKKGQKGQFLKSGSPSARTSPKPKRKFNQLRDNEQDEVAMDYWKRNASRK